MTIWVPVPISEKRDDDPQDIAVREHPPKADQNQKKAGRKHDIRNHAPTSVLDASDARNRSRMTLSSQPTLMPSSTDRTGIAPALKNAPNCPSGSTRLSKKAAGEDQSRNSNQDKQHAGERLQWC